MKGVIMAGGKGQRLHPLTLQTPKPLVPIMNTPVIESSIYWLKSQGITDIAITLHYLSGKVIKFLGNGSRYGVNLTYFVEDNPLGSAGGIRSLSGYLDETFVAISADLLTDFDIKDAIHFHKEKKSQFTILTTKVSYPEQYGVVLRYKDGSIRKFIEKPSKNLSCSDQVNSGIYLIEPDILKWISPNTFCDFSHHLFPIFLSEGIPFYSYEKGGYWIDIGHLSTYLQSQKELLSLQEKVPLGYTEIGHQIWVGPNTAIHELASLQGPLLIGANCIIENGVSVSGGTIIGEGTKINPFASISASIIWDRVVIDSNASLNGTVVASNNHIGERTILLKNSVTGQFVRIGKDCVIGENVQVEPDKVIPDSSYFKKVQVEKLPGVQGRPVPVVGDKDRKSKGIKVATVYCPNSIKARIIRQLIEEGGVEEIDLSEGIKFIHDEASWTQIYSGEKDGALVVCSHSKDEKMALEITRYYVQQIKNYQKV
ncbi:sugar phosphate nucleotidyltransferase [Cytobacillus sp. FJAT-54145]|uniref:Sugar phosphate nucleotidyltransferase n=1 Tax=Cytobacillus spartinae TaxID=3299023 RepID=A0ABW6KE61_9BACI